MMQTPTTTYLTDDTDFCRPCKGTGEEGERSSTGAWMTGSCYFCGGTGTRSIRITKRTAVAA